MPTSQVKSTKITKLPKQRGSKEKPVRMSSSSHSQSAKRSSGASSSFEGWSKEDLIKRARQLGISGRSSMNKSQLVSALRKH